MDASIQVFDPVQQWPYLGLPNCFFFPFFFFKSILTKTSIAVSQSHRPGFLKSFFLTWDVSDHTTDPVCETGVWSLTSQSKLSTKKKRKWSDRQWYGHWRLVQNRLFKKNGKTPGLWDHGVATGEPGQKPIRKKMTRSVRQWYGLWWVKFLKISKSFNFLEIIN